MERRQGPEDGEPWGKLVEEKQQEIQEDQAHPDEDGQAFMMGKEFRSVFDPPIQGRHGTGLPRATNRQGNPAIPSGRRAGHSPSLS